MASRDQTVFARPLLTPPADAQKDSLAFLCSQLNADRELDCDLSLQKLTSNEAQL